jgi:hypothetical protein
MSDALGFAEIGGQHVELLPARTVLSSGGCCDIEIAVDGVDGHSVDGRVDSADGADGN